MGLKLLLKAVVLPLLGAPPINERYAFLAGNPAAIPGMSFTILVSAGFAEELFFRGFLFERARAALGWSAVTRAGTVVFTSVLFALAHHRDQGLPGAQQALLTGLVFGTAFAATGRLWIPIIAHAAFDLLAYAMIYWRLEGPVSRLIFG